MKIVIGICIGIILLSLGCSDSGGSKSTASKKNIAAEVVANLTTVSGSFAPDSLASNNSASSISVASKQAKIMTDICASVSWGVCQSLLIREYVKIGKDSVDLMATFTNGVGEALGNIANGSSGHTDDETVYWSKTDADNWSILVKNSVGDTVAYVSIANGVYTLKFNGNNDDSEPSDAQLETSVTFTSATSWSVNTYFEKTACDVTDPNGPSKVQVKVTRNGDLWSGKAMIYSPRWNDVSGVDCNTTAGDHELAMYTDFVGNNDATKAGLYLIPPTETSLTSPDIEDFALTEACTNFSNLTSQCPGVFGLGNPWCTTAPTAEPTWNDACTAYSTVNAASFSAASEWVEPATLKAYSISFPASL